MSPPKTAVFSAVAAVALISSAGCVYATKVTGPGGREAFRVHCSTPSQCAEKAGEVCSGDYETLSTTTQMDGYANNGTGYANSPHEITISCRTGAPAPRASTAPAAASAAPAPAAASAAPADPAKEGDTCAAALGSVKETAAFWAQLHPEAKRLEEAPSQRDFMEVCRGLPERVQRCLDARYREAHEKPCLAVLRRLEAGEKNKVDSLFLE